MVLSDVEAETMEVGGGKTQGGQLVVGSGEGTSVGPVDGDGRR
jgi:hypothetical protein